MANLIPDLAPGPWFSSNCGSEVVGKSRNQHHRVRGSQIFMVVSGPRGLVLLFYIRPRPRPPDFMTYAPKALWFCHTSKYALDQVGSKRFMRNMSQFTNMRPQNVRMYAVFRGKKMESINIWSNKRQRVENAMSKHEVGRWEDEMADKTSPMNESTYNFAV